MSILILGIDPGLANTGYGFVEVDDAGQRRALDWGRITTPKTDTQGVRLRTIQADVRELIAKYSPDLAVIERMLFPRPTKNAQQTSEARGAIVAVLAEAGIPMEEFTPQQAKMDLTGSGKAEKIEVQEAVMCELGLDDIPRPDHAADALAQVLTYLLRRRYA